MTLTHLIGGIDFGEGPRWHDGALWYSDFYQHSVYKLSPAGERQTMLTIDGRPSGLGWLPDGNLVVVSMLDRSVLRWDGSDVSLYADLSSLATGHCNDMVVAADGTAYVGNFGFDMEAGEEFAAATLIGIRPNGSIFAAAPDMAFPNGSVITPDGATLIVGETFGQGYKAFTINDDGSLSNRRTWAEVPGTAPDGCALDAEGAIWFSDAIGSQVVRVREGGEVTHKIETPQNTYACMLGGDDGKTLFVLTAADAHPDVADGSGTGSIYTMPVDVGRAGRP